MSPNSCLRFAVVTKSQPAPDIREPGPVHQEEQHLDAGALRWLA